MALELDHVDVESPIEKIEGDVYKTWALSMDEPSNFFSEGLRWRRWLGRKSYVLRLCEGSKYRRERGLYTSL